MASKPFSKAAKLFKKRNYEQVIRLLEPQVFRFRESYSFYYLLGFSCLHMGDYGSAYTYLKRGHDLKPSNIDTLLGLAAVHLKRQETAQALEYWLEVLDQDPKNQFALRGMKLLKKNSEPEYLVDFADSGKIERLIPQPSGRYTGKIFLVIIILALLALTSLLYFKVINTEARKNVRLADDFPALFIDDVSSVLEGAESDHPFSISEGEMKKAFQEMQSYFLEGRDNIVRREVNRILLSNASLPVRDKARTILTYLKEPGFADFKDNFSYSDVSAQPALYAGCHVIWKGAVSNLTIGESEIRFDLLVGYDTRRVMEGMVTVSVPFAVRIDPDSPIEVLGSIHLTGNETRPFALSALSIHQ
jgi:hypothetical protein